MSALIQSRWRELINKKAEFLKIVQLLLDYDERSQRLGRTVPPALHYLRRALVLSPPDTLQVFLRNLGGYRYEVIVYHTSGWGTAATTWLHEDAIQVEREQAATTRSHPVHRILCLTDLFRTHSRKLRDLPIQDNWLGDRMQGLHPDMQFNAEIMRD